MKTKTPIYIIVLFLLLLGSVCVYSQSRDLGKSISKDGNHIKIYTDHISDSIQLMFLSDTHMFESDIREDKYKKYSERMSKAYNETSHFLTGEKTNPRQAFSETLEIAKNKRVDLLILGGDIFSYPSEFAIEWTQALLDECKLNYCYTTGNHDWHYEGMEGSLKDLRSKWINKRLISLYTDKNPLYYYVDVKGVRVIVIDNSIYEILPEQLTFFQEQVASGFPLILVMHIPLYAVGRPVSFGCAHPLWNAANDNLYKLERRQQWNKDGHTDITMQFREEVLKASNLLSIFAGHIHQESIDIIQGIPQFVAGENAAGYFFDIEILPITK